MYRHRCELIYFVILVLFTAAHEVQESDGFMAALLQPRTPVVKKKRSASNTNSKVPTSPTEKGSPPQTPLSPTAAPPSVSFCVDNLNMSLPSR